MGKPSSHGSHIFGLDLLRGRNGSPLDLPTWNTQILTDRCSQNLMCTSDMFERSKNSEPGKPVSPSNILRANIIPYSSCARKHNNNSTLKRGLGVGNVSFIKDKSTHLDYVQPIPDVTYLGAMSALKPRLVVEYFALSFQLSCLMSILQSARFHTHH